LKSDDESNVSRLYALLFDYKKIKFLEQHLEENTLNWFEKYRVMTNLVNVLKTFHENNLSPNNFDPGNILISKIDCFKYFIFAGFGRENNIAYTAPEILRGEKRESVQSSDIYALGMIFYRIIFEQGPFPDIKDESQLKNVIIHGVRPQFLQDIPYFLKELIHKCWDANPSNRPTVYDLEILLQNSKYEFQHYNFPSNDKQKPRYISERFYKNSLEYNISTSFYLCKFIE
jgi:serine/threonine protein kinase